MQKAQRLLAAAALALLPALAGAQNVLDIEQNVGDTPYSPTSPRAFQTFTAMTGNLSGGGFYLNTQDAGTAPVTISLVQDWLSATPTVLASAVVALPGSGQFTWVDGFWTPVGVVAGTQYALQISAGPSSQAPYSTTFAANWDVYAGGQAYYQYDGGSYFSPGQYDLQFRTYTATATMSAVPEPSTWALMGTGLLTIGGVAARRRRSTV